LEDADSDGDGYFEEEIAKAVVLALFHSLIISRRQFRLPGTIRYPRDGSGRCAFAIVAVVRREFAAGLFSCMLGAIGLMRILIWQRCFILTACITCWLP